MSFPMFSFGIVKCVKSGHQRALIVIVSDRQLVSLIFAAEDVTRRAVCIFKMIIFYSSESVLNPFLFLSADINIYFSKSQNYRISGQIIIQRKEFPIVLFGTIVHEAAGQI